MKNMKLIPTTALLTVLILCIASPMAMAGPGLQKGHKAAPGQNKGGKAMVDNPEPITGMLALAAAGIGGVAARKRKQKSEEE